jgi:hypothetical protein
MCKGPTWISCVAGFTPQLFLRLLGRFITGASQMLEIILL